MARLENIYLVIGGNLYMAAKTTHECRGENMYPCSLGKLLGDPADIPPHIAAINGEEVELWGMRYEINCLPVRPDADPDEIDLELVYLSMKGDD